MIPKKIHYCWFGGNPLPEMAQKCIASWKKYCPDYEIVEWNETNFDVRCNTYCAQAYDAKKWAFVSDVARLYALVTEGGIYMDTDVEVVKPLDEFLELEAFSGFESEKLIPTGIMAACKGQAMFAELLEDYNTDSFFKEDGTPNLMTNVKRITNSCLKHGLVLNNTKQTVNGFTLFPNDYFCPKDSVTNVLTITENTHTIHHFDGSWMPEENRCMAELKRKYLKWKLPMPVASYMARFNAHVKHRGFVSAVKETLKWIGKK